MAVLQANAETQSSPSEVVTKWNVSLPALVAQVDPAEPPAKPEPVNTPLISSDKFQRDVTEALPMPGLPPVTGRINMTLQVVEAPNLPEPPPVPTSLQNDPEVQARLRELLQNRKATRLVFVSATVYDNHRTFLRIYPSGGIGDEVTAWSNLDFKVFCGCRGYRVTGADGSYQDCSLLMGIGDVRTNVTERMAARAGRQYVEPTIPELPEMATGGPAFVVTAGGENSVAKETLEQLHDLYRKEGARMVAENLARKQAEEERRAQLLANPPKPADVTIKYWKGQPKTDGTEVSK